MQINNFNDCVEFFDKIKKNNFFYVDSIEGKDLGHYQKYGIKNTITELNKNK
jgi:hypothetical protein